MRHHFRKHHPAQVAQEVSTVPPCIHDPHELHCYCRCHRAVCPTDDQMAAYVLARQACSGQMNHIGTFLRVALEVSAHSFEQRATVDAAVDACCGCDCDCECVCLVRPMGPGCWPGLGYEAWACQFASLAATAAACCCCCSCGCGWGCACVVGAACWPCLCSEDWAHWHNAQALGLLWLWVTRNRRAERRRHRMRPSAHALG